MTSPRTQAILDSIDALIAEHDRWERDPNAPAVPTEALDLAVDACIETCLKGDLPAECRSLINNVADFCDLWLDYRDGEHEPGYKPKRKVWTAFNELREARTKESHREIKRVESVSLLRAQGVSDQQIAIIYGLRNEKTDLYEGPFWTDGRIRTDLIEQQHRAEQGHKGIEPVIPKDWVHPINHQLANESASAVSRRLRNLESRVSIAEPPPDKGSPDELILGGAYPHQVQAAFGLTEAETIAHYERLGKDHTITPDLGDTPPEPKQETAPEPTADKPKLSESENAEVEALILELSTDDTLAATDIARKVSEQTGQDIGYQKVNAVIRKAKQQEAVA